MNLLGALALDSLNVDAGLHLVGVIGLAARCSLNRCCDMRLAVRALVRLWHLLSPLPFNVWIYHLVLSAQYAADIFPFWIFAL